MVARSDCCDDILWPLYVYIQIDPIQFVRLRIPYFRLIVIGREMVICAAIDAKVQAGLAQSNRYDLFHATMDDCRHFAIGYNLRRYIHNTTSNYHAHLDQILYIPIGESFVKAANGLLNSPDGGGFLLLKITIAAFIAFAMEISEFLVLSYTSSLTLSVAGIFKVLSISTCLSNLNVRHKP